MTSIYDPRAIDVTETVTLRYSGGGVKSEWEEPRYAIEATGFVNFCKNVWYLPITDRMNLIEPLAAAKRVLDETGEDYSCRVGSVRLWDRKKRCVFVLT